MRTAHFRAAQHCKESMMDITDQHPANDEPLKGLRCDCCKTWVANTDLQTMFELAEFVRIRM